MVTKIQLNKFLGSQIMFGKLIMFLMYTEIYWIAQCQRCQISFLISLIFKVCFSNQKSCFNFFTQLFNSKKRPTSFDVQTLVTFKPD